MNREAIVDLVARLPQGTISRAWGWASRRERPRLAVDVLKRAFVNAVGVDLGEALEPIGNYHSVEDLFVRRLRPGARRIDPDPEAVVSPVDGTYGSAGFIREGELLQVKGRTYSVSRLLGSEAEGSRFDGGSYATFYLSPKDYHRIHAPLSGEVAEGTLIPGRLLPVFKEALERVDELFARNERLISYLDCPDAGRLAVVKVGATLVGRITVSYDPGLATNRAGQSKRKLRYRPPREITKGAELGAFELGSTVVLLAEPGRIDLAKSTAGQPVRMGQRIGTVVARKSKQPARKKASSKSKSKSKKRGGRTGKSRIASATS